jgi:hypothetical protein
MDGDFTLNVRQIAQYQFAAAAAATDAILIQQGGIGGPYAYTSPAGIVGPAIAQAITTATLNLTGVGPIFWAQGQFLQATSSSFSFNWPGTPGLLLSIFPTGDATLTGMLSVGRDPATPYEVSTKNYVDATVATAKQLITDNSVWTVNGKQGNVNLTWIDLIGMGGAPIMSPAFQGVPTAPSISDLNQHDWQIPNTAFVQDVVSCNINGLLRAHPFVWTFNGRTGDIVLTDADLVGLSIVIPESPAFTGTPTTPTPPVGDNSTIVANTEFVTTAIAGLASIYAPINSPSLTGYATAPTAAPGTSDGQIATTAFVAAAVAAATAGVSSFNGRTGTVVLTTADITGAGGATLVSPVFTGTPQAPTAAPGNSSVQIATTAFVMAAVAATTAGVSSFNTRTGAVVLTAADVTGAGGAPLNSPGFTGVPTGPTAAPGSSTTELATTAFVTSAISTAIAAIPPGVTTFNGRSGAVTLGVNDISAAGGAVLASPAFTGIPTAPTAAVGVSTTQLATTAFVAAAVAASTAGVSSFNGRSGVVTLTTADVTSAGGAPIAAPAFTGTPTAVTATAGTSTTQLATTAFVMAALGTIGVSSFNGRTGAVTLIANDVSAVGGALLASPTFTGIPAAPTAAPGVSTTQLATCAFVAAAIAAGGGVTSFNGRAGVVTLSAADITGAGGALLAGPAFTGTPTAPTAAQTVNNTQLATTAFVTTKVAGYLPLTGGTLSGALTINFTSTTLPVLTLTDTASGGGSWLKLNYAANAAGGASAALISAAGANQRWAIFLGNGDAESGGNAGSNFNISRYGDTGVGIDSPFSIARSSGAVSFSGTVAANGGAVNINATAGVPQLNLQIGGTANSFINDNGTSFNFYSNSAGSAGMYLARGGSAWTAISDARLSYKKTARRLSTLERLEHVQLYENEVDGRLELFAKAQEINKSFPHVVKRGDDDESYVPTGMSDERAWGLSYERLGIVALQGVKELLGRIEKLEAALETIRSRA